MISDAYEYEVQKKSRMRSRLRHIALDALKADGWKVARVPRNRKLSIRRITKGSRSEIVSICTSQSRHLAYAHSEYDDSWLTLSEVDMVVAVSVDNKEQPKYAYVHLMDGDDIRARFDRAYKAVNADRDIPFNNGIWISLYEKESSRSMGLAGAGAGLKYPPFAKVPLWDIVESPASTATISPSDIAESLASSEIASTSKISPDEPPLSIAEAKRRLATTFGVAPENIKIIVET